MVYYKKLTTAERRPDEKRIVHELLASVQEMDEIVQGKKAAVISTEFPEPDAKLIQEKIG